MAKEKLHCSHCGALMLTYEYRFSKLMFNLFVKLYNQDTPVVNLSEMELTYSQRANITRLKHWGLIAKSCDEFGTHIVSHWYITQKGYAFMRDGSLINRVVYVYRNKVVDVDAELISKHDFLGHGYTPNLNYEQREDYLEHAIPCGDI